MTAPRKPLDLAAFDGLLDPKALCPYCDEYSIPKEIPLLLAECRAQREQIKALREALEEAANDLRRHDAHQSEAEARAVLAATQGDA